jgi:hypothetical protein
MAEEQKSPWLNYLALTTVVLAVCATLSTFRGSSYSTKSVLAQSQASNQWSYYQSKSIKGYLYEIGLEELELELKEKAPSLSPELLTDYRKMIDDYRTQVVRYDGEKKIIDSTARSQETRRDWAQVHSQTFGVAVIFLQIAILLSSIAALIKKKPIWYLGMAVGSVGMVYFVMGVFF